MELHNIIPIAEFTLAYDNVNPAMVISMMLCSSMPTFEKVYVLHIPGTALQLSILFCK